MKKLTVLLAMLAIIAMGSAQAAVDSIKVSGDITAMAVTRNVDMGASNTEDGDDYLYSQVRLRFDAMLTEGVSGVVQLINERLWGQEGVSTSPSTAYDADNNLAVDLDLAYIQLQEFFTPELTLIIGRQYLRYGSGLIIGDPDTNQGVAMGSSGTVSKGVPVATAMSDLTLRKSFDAVRAVIDYSPFVVDLIFSKIHEDVTYVEDDITLWGINVAYTWDDYNGMSELYYFNSDNPLEFSDGDKTSTQDDDWNTNVIGVRSQVDVGENFTVMGEYAYQFGDSNAPSSSVNDNRLSAWAAILGLEWRKGDEYNTKLGVRAVYLSGNDDTADRTHEAWDPMFEDMIPAEIMNYLFTNSNLKYLTANGSFMPREDVTLGALYTVAWLSETNATGSSTYSPTIGPASGNTYAVSPGERGIGSEVNLFATYDYTEDVQFKLMGAMFFPGDYFDEANQEKAYSVRGGLTLDF